MLSKEDESGELRLAEEKAEPHQGSAAEGETDRKCTAPRADVDCNSSAEIASQQNCAHERGLGYDISDGAREQHDTNGDYRVRGKAQFFRRFDDGCDPNDFGQAVEGEKKGYQSSDDDPRPQSEAGGWRQLRLSIHEWSRIAAPLTLPKLRRFFIVQKRQLLSGSDNFGGGLTDKPLQAAAQMCLIIISCCETRIEN